MSQIELERPGDYAGRWRLVLLLFLAAASLFALTSSGRFGNSDAESMVATSEALASRGALDIGDCEPRDNHCVPGTGGLKYSGFGILPSLMATPAVLVSQGVAKGPSLSLVTGFAVSMTGVLIAAALVAAMGALTLSFGYRPRSALWISSLLALASPLWFYATKGYYSEPLFSLLLVGCIICLNRTPTRIAYTAAGFLCGAAVATRVVGVLLVAALVWYGVRRLQAERNGQGLSFATVLAFVVPLAMWALFLSWLNWFRFGDVLLTGYHRTFPTAAAMLSSPLLAGVSGLLFDGAVGLIWYFPLILLVPAAAASFRRRDAILVEFVVLAFAVNLAFFAKYAIWWGGWSIGPRLLFPVIPFLLLPLAEWIERPSPRRVVGLTMLAMAGMAVQMAWVVPSHFRYFTERTRVGQFAGARVSPASAVRFAVGATVDAVHYATSKSEDTAQREVALRSKTVNLLAPDIWWVKAWMLGRSPALVLAAVSLLFAGFAFCAVSSWLETRRTSGMSPRTLQNSG